MSAVRKCKVLNAILTLGSVGLNVFGSESRKLGIGEAVSRVM